MLIPLQLLNSNVLYNNIVLGPNMAEAPNPEQFDVFKKKIRPRNKRSDNAVNFRQLFKAATLKPYLQIFDIFLASMATFNIFNMI